MLLEPRPGVTGVRLRDALDAQRMGIVNARGSGSIPDRYRQWANIASAALRPLVGATEVDRLVLTRRYWQLARAGFGTIDLVMLELADRLADFDEALADLDADIKRWSPPEIIVVADTTVYIEAPDKIEDLDFRPLVAVREEPIRLVVPIAVLDELEGLKRHQDRHKRWRAGYSLAVFEDRLPNGVGAARLRAADFSPLDDGGIPRGEISIEVLFDPPGHLRLPISDDEIVARSAALQAVSGRDVHLLTYDTTMSLRARAARLTVTKMRKSDDPEPGDSEG
jgi:hypothetical protein